MPYLCSVKTKNKSYMSTAELTAHRIFDSYRFQGLPDDVKRHLAILCISTTTSEADIKTEDPLFLTDNEKETRARAALMDAQTGNSYSTEEVCNNLDKKYPWLCK